MLRKLKKDIFVFSGCKSTAELLEASSLLVDLDGKIRSWNDFKTEMQKLHQLYNVHYLEVEHNFATQSATMAARWHQDSEGDPGRYLLQYRTAGDERVRESHQAMNGITLPATDPFWNDYYPPNGWRCRCTAVQVLKSKHGPTDKEKAMQAGEQATTHIDSQGRNKLAMFRFNPGKQQVIFPPSHPYYKFKDAAAHAEKTPTSSNQRSEKNKEIERWVDNNIPQYGLTVALSNFQSGSGIIIRKNVNSIARHFTEPGLKDMAKDIMNIVKNSSYIESKPFDKTNEDIDPSVKKKVNRGVESYNYYKFTWRGETYRLNVEIIKGEEYPYMVNKIVNAR